MIDEENRQIDYMRISVTDRCNFRCSYCMPEEGVESIAHSEILTFEEILMIVKSGVDLGISKIKLTGGEPLIRKGFVDLVRSIGQIKGIESISVTTNGLLLGEQLEDLIDAGMTDVNISLDTLDAEKFQKITHVDGLNKVLDSIHKAASSSLRSVKVNVVAMKGFNEDEVIALAELGKNEKIHVRFIEIMPIGLGEKISRLTQDEVFKKLEKAYGILTPYEERLGNGPAKYWKIQSFEGKVGFISAMSDCFCENCNRIRITSNGYLKLCLHSTKGIDLKTLLRVGCDTVTLTKVMKNAISGKPARHQFDEECVDERENKTMVQIGG